MTETSGPSASGAQRAAELLLSLSALGEIAVGVVGLAFPQVIALLMDATLDAGGLLVARMLGTAALALGVTWWLARRDADRLSRYAAGFFVYNFGIAALFAFAAMAAARPALPWVVCATHLVVGAAFGAATRAHESAKTAG